MSLIVAGCVMLLALLASIVLDDADVRKSQETRRDMFAGPGNNF